MGIKVPPETWVFAYGSLMWNPGFDAPEAALARLDGYARSFCMWSIHHRGTESDPGLVLALDTDEGAHCRGMAFRLPDEGHDEVLAELRERELISSAYYEAQVPLALDDGRHVEALAYIVARDHVQYCGGLPLERQAQVIAQAAGGRGPNTEYLFNTAAHLTELGIEDDDLTALARRVRQLNA